MPTLEQNLRSWNADYRWDQNGEEWSAVWGGSESQWFGSILPRVQAFMPTGTILEIAPGYGRWTQYLVGYCHRLIAIDLAEKCVDACRKRFGDLDHVTFHVNDGRSLDMVEEASVDFAFSFDSLVHAESAVIEAYLQQLSRKLTPNGVGFFHHSNIGMYQRSFSIMHRVPPPLRRRLIRTRVLDSSHWRAFSMTAERFERICREAELQCIGQELVNWSTWRAIDCFSLFTRKGSVWERPNRVLKNTGFMREAKVIRRLGPLYGRRSFDRLRQHPAGTQIAREVEGHGTVR